MPFTIVTQAELGCYMVGEREERYSYLSGQVVSLLAGSFPRPVRHLQASAIDDVLHNELDLEHNNCVLHLPELNGIQRENRQTK